MPWAMGRVSLAILLSVLLPAVALQHGHKVNASQVQYIQASNDPVSGVEERLTNITWTAEAGSWPVRVQPVAAARSELASSSTAAVSAFDGGIQLVVVYIACLVAMTVTVVCLYSGQGVWVVVNVSIYLLALSTVRLSVKAVYEFGQFEYPIFLTFLHVLVSSIVGWTLVLHKGDPIDLPSAAVFFGKFVPVAVAFGCSLMFNNMALSMTSASYSEIIGATTPMVTIVAIMILGLPLNYSSLLPTCLVVIGAVLAITGDVTASTMGTALCFLATICRALKTILQQELLKGAASSTSQEKYEPCLLMAWTCAIIAVLLGVWTVTSEGMEPIRICTGVQAGTGSLAQLWLAILLSCFNACVVNYAMLLVMQELGAVGVQVAAQVRIILTVVGDIAIFHSDISIVECGGMFMVLLGAYLFSRAQAETKEKGGSAAKEELQGEVPEAMATDSKMP